MQTSGRKSRADGIFFLRSQGRLSLFQSDLIQVESNQLDAVCAVVLNNESAHPNVTASDSENFAVVYSARFSMSWSAWLPHEKRPVSFLSINPSKSEAKKELQI